MTNFSFEHKEVLIWYETEKIIKFLIGQEKIKREPLETFKLP